MDTLPRNNLRTLRFATLAAAALLITGCSKKLDGPTPVLGTKTTLPIAPAIVCGDQLTTTLTLDGANLSPVPVNVPKHPAIALPSLTLSRSAALDGGSADRVSVLYGGDPTAPSNTPLLTWDGQAQMKFTINQALEIAGGTGRLPSGIFDALVRNPNGKQASAKAALAVVDKPSLNEVAPPLLCLAQGDRDLTLSGSSFVRIGQGLPALSVDSVDMPFAVSGLTDCTTVAQKDIDAEVCQTAQLTLAQDSIAPGSHALVLTNPETAACHSEEDLALRIVAAPAISAVTPQVACSLDTQQHLSIQGQGFLQIGSDMPNVKLAGQDVAVSSLSNCDDLDTTGLTVKSCSQIDLDVDIASFSVGDVAIEVTNPDPAGCDASATGVFRIAGPPTLSGINPADVCSDVPTTFAVSGSGFDPGATASVDGVAASMVTFVSDKELQASMPGLSTGTHAFTVSNGGSCSVTLPAALTVDPSPIVFFVDPPVIYGQIPVQVTIFTSGLSANATKVELVRAGGTERHTLDFNSTERPNKILAKVPAGLTAASWDVVVTNAGGCPGTLPGGLIITDTLTDSLVASIKPSYASTTEDTAVTITGSGFAPVPRVYLSASGASSSSALSAVEVSAGGGTLTAVIPSGLTPGQYDLIVVNPDGKVDVLANGVTITADKPPVVTAVTPESLPSNAANAPVTIAGTGFKTGLSVVLDCLTTNGTRTTVPTTAQAPSGGTSVVVNVTMGSATPSAVDAGSVCLVRLTNADGAFFEYSAFSVTNSSLNLSAWKSAPDLVTARRALSLVAGRPTATSRFLYAIGGDSGTTNAPNTRGSSVFDSVESSQVDVFGDMSSWSVQRNHLTAPRTAAGAATIGRFVYLIGGYDGSAATNTLLRASILDPLTGPQIADIDAALSDGSTGLGKGLYYYRVAALRPGDDLANPGGETLPGELLPVQLPDRSEKIVLTLKWNPAAGAHGYRIYRSPQADAAADGVELLGEITCGSANTACDCNADPTRCHWVDSGGATMSGKTPLPPGSLGVWHATAGARCSSGDCLLGSAREGLTVTSVPDPADATKVYLYAFGGRDQTGTYLDSYEVATVSIAADGSQTVADFAAGSDTLSVPRADHGVWVMSKSNSNVIASSGSPNDVWVYVGGGRTTGNATDKTLEAGKLGAAGILNAFVSTDPLNGALVGFGTGASNDQLYTFGGVAGTADGTSAQLCDGTGGCSPLPDLKPGAFNALGAATTQRMYTGSTQESAFFFVAGGHDGSKALKSAQRTVQ